MPTGTPLIVYLPVEPVVAPRPGPFWSDWPPIPTRMPLTGSPVSELVTVPVIVPVGPPGGGGGEKSSIGVTSDPLVAPA